MNNDPQRGWRRWQRILFCSGGWVLAVSLGVLVLPWSYRRLTTRIPAVQRAEWNRHLLQKQAQLAAITWEDKRPLILLAGDSHIEFGNWYDLWQGACAVRNCGLARARIRDVTDLVHSVAERHPDTVILMCGINNVGQNDSTEECVRQYADLLQTGRSLGPRQLLVLSVLPLRQSLIDARSKEVNRAVAEFNQQLATLCQSNGAVFVDLRNGITNSSGGLADNLTVDGLHLNPDGYEHVATTIKPLLRTAARPSM